MHYSKGRISIPHVRGTIAVTVHASALAPAANHSIPSQWVTGRRIDSSGTIGSGSRAYLSNAIKVKAGDTVRIKNAGTMAECYPAVFSSDSTDVGVIGTRMNPSQSGEVTVIPITASGFFRQPMLISELSTDALKNSVVITKNEMIV